jgi:hypothetical protein
MIYIKRLDTCFLRIPKTGSQSLLLFLQDNVVDLSEDIISRPISIRYESPFTDLKLSNLAHNTQINFITAHVNAQFIIDNGICTSSTKFIGVIRNPYERQISNYLYRINRKQNDIPKNENDLIYSFRKSVNTGILSTEKVDTHIDKQCNFFKYNGTFLNSSQPWLLDNLKNTLEIFCNNHSIKIKHPLEHINRSIGDKKKLIDKLYTEELKQKVYEVYKEDFELYNKLKGLS